MRKNSLLQEDNNFISCLRSALLLSVRLAPCCGQRITRRGAVDPLVQADDQGHVLEWPATPTADLPDAQNVPAQNQLHGTAAQSVQHLEDGSQVRQGLRA